MLPIYGCRLVLKLRSCNTLCTSGFVDGVWRAVYVPVLLCRDSNQILPNKRTSKYILIASCALGLPCSRRFSKFHQWAIPRRFFTKSFSRTCRQRTDSSAACASYTAPTTDLPDHSAIGVLYASTPQRRIVDILCNGPAHVFPLSLIHI